MPTTTPLFLLSLPRSGSTYLQGLLGSHEQIATSPEPWLLLPLLYARRDFGVWAEYDHSMQRMALSDIEKRLPAGSADLDEAIRQPTLAIYSKLAGTAPYFLDKTPRYHLIVDDLFRLFPDAKFVFLWRNPIAVAASMIDAWGTGKWNLSYWEIDLYRGLSALLKAEEGGGESVQTIRYEDLVADPTGTTERVLDFLGLTSDGLGDLPDLGDRLGDRAGRVGVKPSVDPLERWHKTMANPLRKRWVKNYLDWIGDERLKQMGYERSALQASVDEIPASLHHASSDLVLRVKGGVVRKLRGRLLSQQQSSLG